MKVKSVVVLLVCLIPVMVMGQDKTYTVEVKDGVRYVYNEKPLWGDEPKIRLVLVGHLGEFDSDDENFMFYNPSDIAGDTEGNLYVLDAGTCRVQKFDKKGRYLDTFGREGEGPAEFVYFESDNKYIDIDLNGNIYVSEPYRSIIQVLTPKGKWMRTVRIVSSGLRHYVLSTGEILIMNPNLNGGRGLSKGNVPLLRILDEEGKTKREIGQGIYFTKFPESTGGNRLLISTDKDDYIYTSFLFQNRIEKYAIDGKHVFTAERPLPSERLTSKDPDLYATITQGIGVDDKGRICVISKKRYTRREESLTPNAKYDDNGRLIRTADEILESMKRKWPDLSVLLTETDMYVLELFTSEGILLYKFPLTHFCDGLRIIDNRIYILDKNRTMQFYIYEIIEN
ncbi:hypothetical protein ACFL7D_11650 [candidate division KSB1 bacterium]